jgi:hypothetical protein
MRWILLLPPTIAGGLVLCGVGVLTYVILISPPIADSGPLRLREDVTHICLGFTSSYCDETVGPSPALYRMGPWKPCGMDFITSPPKVAVLLVPHECDLPKPKDPEDLPDVPALTARAYELKGTYP